MHGTSALLAKDLPLAFAGAGDTTLRQRLNVAAAAARTAVDSYAKTLETGRQVFAENCAGCHSSKKPPAGTAPDAAKAWYRIHVNDPDFFTDLDQGRLGGRAVAVIALVVSIIAAT